MTTLTPDFELRRADAPAFERPSILGPDRTARAPREEPVHDHGRPTLDDLIVGAWEGLSAHHTVSCPVCSGALAPRYGAGPAPVGGRCRDCGSTLG